MFFFFKESSKLIFQIFYWRYQHLVEKCNVHCIHMTKVNFGSNLTIVSLLCLIYEGWHFTTIYGNHLHDRIIPIRGRIWPLKLLVVYPRHFFIEVPIRQDIARSCISVFGLSMLPLFSIRFWKWSDDVLFVVFSYHC